MRDGQIFMPDLSEVIHGENEVKTTDQFRNYDESIERVRRTYYNMHENQTVEFVERMREKWLRFDKEEMTIMEALEKLNDIIDESDPDTDLPNIVHAFQTAERVREVHPDKPWYHLVGLIHDLGKLMAFYDEPHWAVCGDTFPVGCQPDPKIVFGLESFKHNPDLKNPVYNSELGIYWENCGIDSLQMSWGHDEYLYQVLVNHGSTIPEAGLNVIRYHSFYPWHQAGSYRHFMRKDDELTLAIVQDFNQFDLYSKSDTVPDIQKLMPYYQSLVDTYCPGKIKW